MFNKNQWYSPSCCSTKMLSLFRKHEFSVKNQRKEEYDIPKNLDLLNKWSIPKIEPRLIYQLGTFEKLGLKEIIKTSEESVPMYGEELKIKLLNHSDLQPYMESYHYVHIGLIQVAFKPLTLSGLPGSFLAVLRDARNLNWKQSLIGIMQSSLAHGPVYFNAYPNLQLSLTDVNIFDALTLLVKTHGYNYAPGTEVISICYRIYYKPLYTLNPKCKLFEMNHNETIIFETNFNRSRITTRRPIKWEEIEFPESWVAEDEIAPKQVTDEKPTQIIQTPEGTVHIQFENRNKDRTVSLLGPSKMLRSLSTSHSYISPLDYVVEYPRSSTSQIRTSKEESLDNESVTPSSSSKVEGIRKTDNVLKGVYANPIDPEITESEMDFGI